MLIKSFYKTWSLPHCTKKLVLALLLNVSFVSAFVLHSAEAYPIFAQQNYPNPREANGRIVCANCHLAQKAVEIEDRLAYTEPPDWFFSVRLALGDWLVKAKRFAEAEDIYRQDLTTFPENGWALIGLYNSLKGQGNEVEAKGVKQRFDKAWQWSDIKINSSRIH